MHGSIIVGVDGSETAHRAAQAAARLAAERNASLHLVTAYGNEKTEVKEIAGEAWTISNASEALRIAQRTAALLAEETGIQASAVAEAGKPHEALTREALRLHAGTIVVGNRGMKGIGRVLGSVANSVAHRAPCDVYIVKTD